MQSHKIRKEEIYYKKKAEMLDTGWEEGEILRARGKPEGAEVELQGKGKLVSEMVIEDRR